MRCNFSQIVQQTFPQDKGWQVVRLDFVGGGEEEIENIFDKSSAKRGRRLPLNLRFLKVILSQL